MNTDQPKITGKQYLKLHPEKFVMVTYEFGEPIFIAPCLNLRTQVTFDISEAEKWSAPDNSPHRLAYHATATGYKQLIYEQC